METTLSWRCLSFSPSSFSLLFPPLRPNSLRFPTSSLRSIRRRKLFTVLCSLSSTPCDYGGWEDLELPEENDQFDPVRDFMVSIGIGDQKHTSIFLIGFASALLVSRLRLSLLALFPISVLVFVSGFSAGVVQGGSIGRIGRIVDAIRVPEDRIRDLGSFFSDLDGKMADLRAGVETGKMEGCLEAVEYVRSLIVNAKKDLENSLEMVDVGRKSNHKSSKKKGDFGEIGEIGSQFVQFLGGLFQESEDSVKQSMKASESAKGDVAGKMKAMVERDGIQDKSLHSVLKNNVGGSMVDESGEPLGRLKKTASDYAKNFKNSNNNDSDFRADDEMNRKGHSGYGGGDKYSSHMLSYDGEVDRLNRSSKFSSKRGSYRRMYVQQSYESHTSNSSIHDFTDHALHKRKPESAYDFYGVDSEELLSSEETLAHGRSDTPYNGIRSREEAVDPRSQSIPVDRLSACETEEGTEFNLLVKEASDLIKQARQCFMGQADEERVDSILYRSASLLSTAVAIKPMSLLAVGQLGNTYLLHGELKLKYSRELRTMLARNDDSEGHRWRYKRLDAPVQSREEAASVLIDMCEECEELLIEAGRKYRSALSIDGNDVRALYNWGLALSFRAQLIADIGPEAAFDADRVYLAAIDKFDAMASRSNAYAPDALFRWGIALQHRSHLRSHNTKEKMKLLQQAKSLFEDVLSVESSNHQVREALKSCTSELNRRTRL
ncbi:TPR-like protein [Dioscorea alata]|uniref:TPR-like protein n=1 Tax=Dioscorea alata TaxID=55571 RepID=A0ACB7V752_DIOAL|nr:TPR-like protein [Dioscorea alata]